MSTKIDIWRDGRGGIGRVEAWGAHVIVERVEEGDVRIVVETHTPDGRIGERRTLRLRTDVQEATP